MASLYPTLEDMKVDQIQKAQMSAAQSYAANPFSATATATPTTNGGGGGASSDLALCYPSLMEEYMGLRLEPPSGPIVPPNVQQQQQIAHRAAGGVAPVGGGRQSSTMMVAPLTGQNNVGLIRAQVTHGIREVILCKDGEGKVGVKLRDVNKGVFIQFVKQGSPAALAGLRFGDQLLQIDGQNVAGYSGEKAMKVFEKADPKRIVLAVRDRPFERTVTLHKDSSGYVGFTYKEGKIIALVKDSSAARNGLLTEHQILEINGQNVIGLKDKDIGAIIEAGGQTVTVTVMPSVIYEHMVKCMADGLLKKFMDHSVPDYY